MNRWKLSDYNYQINCETSLLELITMDFAHNRSDFHGNQYYLCKVTCDWVQAIINSFLSGWWSQLLF